MIWMFWVEASPDFQITGRGLTNLLEPHRGRLGHTSTDFDSSQQTIAVDSNVAVTVDSLSNVGIVYWARGYGTLLKDTYVGHAPLRWAAKAALRIIQRTRATIQLSIVYSRPRPPL